MTFFDPVYSCADCGRPYHSHDDVHTMHSYVASSNVAEETGEPGEADFSENRWTTAVETLHAMAKSVSMLGGAVGQAIERAVENNPADGDYNVAYFTEGSLHKDGEALLVLQTDAQQRWLVWWGNRWWECVDRPLTSAEIRTAVDSECTDMRRRSEWAGHPDAARLEAIRIVLERLCMISGELDDLGVEEALVAGLTRSAADVRTLVDIEVRRGQRAQSAVDSVALLREATERALARLGLTVQQYAQLADHGRVVAAPSSPTVSMAENVAIATPVHRRYRYRHVGELLLRDDGYRIEYKRNGTWFLWAEYKHCEHAVPEVADVLMLGVCEDSLSASKLHPAAPQLILLASRLQSGEIGLEVYSKSVRDALAAAGW